MSRIRLGVWTNISTSIAYETLYRGGGGLHRDPHKWVGSGKIKVMGSYNYFVVRQISFLGISDHCVEKNQAYSLST